jgi:enoyl-CoA hydratase/carnithine racemase
MPFINLALVPKFGTSYSIPARIGYLRAAELIQLGQTVRFAAWCGTIIVGGGALRDWPRPKR